MAHLDQAIDGERALLDPASVFDTPEDVLNQAAQIHQQSVATKAMPIGNS